MTWAGYVYLLAYRVWQHAGLVVYSQLVRNVYPIPFKLKAGQLAVLARNLTGTISAALPVRWT